MSAGERDDSVDERFERLLLDSARRDELPGDLDSAWQKFDSALRGVSLLAAGTGGAVAARRAQRWLAAKWLIWGALGGSAVTAFGVRAWLAPRAEASAVLSVATLPTIADSAPLPVAEAAVPRSKAPATEVTEPSIVAPPRAPKARSRSPGPASPLLIHPSSSSTLAAQVALLDAARAASSSGAQADALRLADRYRAEFPNGELAPEAEVVAIEALVARGAQTEASERAQRFFARYPGDPHAARVKWLVR